MRERLHRFAPPGSPGRPVPADPANTVRPSGSLHVLALQGLVPFLARYPSMVSSEPSGSVLRLHPCRVNELGALPSHCQADTVPSALRASRYTQMCGLRHSTFVT